MLRIREGSSPPSVEDLLSHSTGKTRRETPLCLRIILVSQNFVDKGGEGEGREFHDSAPKFCCFTLLKKFVEKLFCVSENFWYRKKLRIAEWASRHTVGELLSHSTEKLLRGTLCCSETFWYQTIFMDKKEMSSQHSVEDLFSHSNGKLRKGTLLCFRTFLVSQNFMDKRDEGEAGSITILHRNFVASC